MPSAGFKPWTSSTDDRRSRALDRCGTPYDKLVWMFFYLDDVRISIRFVWLSDMCEIKFPFRGEFSS